MYAEIAKNRIFERQSYVPRCHYPTVAYSRLMAAFVNSTLSLAPLHEGSFGPLHTQRGLLKPHFGNAKDGSNGTFRVPYRSNFRFGRRRPLFFIFIACESLFGCRVVFARYGPSPGLFPEFHRIRYADLRPWHVPVCRSAHPACGCADRPDNKLRNRKHVKRLHVNLMLTMTAATGPSGFLM